MQKGGIMNFVTANGEATRSKDQSDQFDDANENGREDISL